LRLPVKWILPSRRVVIRRRLRDLCRQPRPRRRRIEASEARTNLLQGDYETAMLPPNQGASRQFWIGSRFERFTWRSFNEAHQSKIRGRCVFVWRAGSTRSCICRSPYSAAAPTTTVVSQAHAHPRPSPRAEHVGNDPRWNGFRYRVDYRRHSPQSQPKHRRLRAPITHFSRTPGARRSPYRCIGLAG
jgi:hypothetical protein